MKLEKKFFGTSLQLVVAMDECDMQIMEWASENLHESHFNNHKGNLYEIDYGRAVFVRPLSLARFEDNLDFLLLLAENLGILKRALERARYLKLRQKERLNDVLNGMIKSL